MGLPGSGKSTLCDEVMRISRRPWARICQDSINNGKSGTKNPCLSSAADALKSGKSIFIDRCNIDREQREDFLKLGGEQVEKHALVLDLATKICISRSVKRSGHEGNLEGGKAAAVVNRMAPKKELPKLSEGFTRITICQDERDVNQTIIIYGSFGPFDSLPSGYYGFRLNAVEIDQETPSQDKSNAAKEVEGHTDDKDEAFRYCLRVERIEVSRNVFEDEPKVDIMLPSTVDSDTEEILKKLCRPSHAINIVDRKNTSRLRSFGKAAIVAAAVGSIAGSVFITYKVAVTAEDASRTLNAVVDATKRWVETGFPPLLRTEKIVSFDSLFCMSRTAKS